MKKLLLACFGLLLGTLINAQITLGSGTTTGTYPIASNWGYNYTQQIISKATLNAAGPGSITGLKFYLSANASLDKSNQWEVFIGHTTLSTFAGTAAANWIPVTAMTQVFTGTITNNAGVVEVTFTTPFAYNNTDNLVIAVHENTPNFNTTSDYFYTSASGTTNSSMYYRNDNVDFNPASPIAAGGRTATLSNITILGLTPSVPPCPLVSAPAAAATGVALLPTITWGNLPSATSYKISLGTTPGGTDVMNMVDVGNVTSYTLANSLNYITQYYYTVYATNSIGTSAACTERSFTTLPLPCPTISAPTAAQQGLSVRPTFTWVATTGATGYRLNIGTSAGASDVLSNFDLGNILIYTLTTAQQLIPNTQYYYTITSYNSYTSSIGCTERNLKTANAAIPANDECINAVTLTVNPDLACGVTTAGNTLGATNSLAATPCTGNPDDDVWYKFVATNNTHYVRFSNIVSTGASTTTDMYVQVLSGACGSLTSVVCSDSDTTSIISGLTPGTTYYVRVYTYGGPGNNASFNICVGTPPAAPANDECINATTVTVNPDMNCGSVVSGTTVSATSSGVSVGTCTGTADDDVWYKFTATTTSHTVWLKNVVSAGLSSDTSLYTQVFSGACGALTSIKCITSNTAYTVLTGLNAGETYYVRVYNSNTNTATTTYANTFDLCIGTLPPAPANDNCANAVGLTVNNDLNCGVTMAGTTLSATSSGVAVGTCTGNPDDDVWYSFVATSTTHRVALSNVVSTGTTSSTSLYTQVFSGACGALTSVQCGTTTTTNLTGLTVGQTYYIRVYNSNGAGYSNSFNICIGTPPPPPVNDVCSGAIALTVGNNFATNAIVATNVSATTDGTTTCQTNRINNVWFSVVVPASGSVTVETAAVTGSGFIDSVLSAHSGVCGSLVNVACHDDIQAGTNNFSKISLTGQTPGATLYFSVWRYSSTGADGQFQISAYDSSIALATGEVKAEKDNLKIYPNPFADVLNVSDIKNVKSISITDIAGRLVKTIEKPESTLYLGELKSGMYLVTLQMNDGSKQTIKAIKR